MHRFIAAEKANHSVSRLCEVLEVSRSGYYAAQRRPACRRDVEDERLGELIAGEHKRSRKTYGAPRIHTQLTRRGERVGKKRVARIMRKRGLSGLIPKRRGRTTISVPGVETSPDLVMREWNPTEPNRLWVADITYVRTWEGWIYLAAVLDCYSRKVVGWSIAEHLRAELVVDAVEMAISRRRPEAGLVHHSDRGSQPGLNRSSQRSLRGKNLGKQPSSRRLARRAGRSGDSCLRVAGARHRACSRSRACSQLDHAP